MRRVALTVPMLLVSSLVVAPHALAATESAPAEPVPAGAVANPGPHVLTQPDGTTLDAVAFGDRANGGFETLDGYTIVQDEDGWWVYADERDGELEASNAPANGAPPAQQSRHERAEPVPTAGPAPAPLAPRTGSEPMLTILVEFTDQNSVGTDQADWNDLVFDGPRSLRQYYEDASSGVYTVGPAAETDASNGGAANDGVVGWLSLAVPHPNDNSTGNRTAAQLAIEAADPYVDYSAFDTNGDNILAPDELHLLVVMAGYEASFTNGNNTCGKETWGHRWTVPGGTNLDGVNVAADGYMMIGEHHCGWDWVANANVDRQSTIGIVIHELGHDLGLPDLYDYDNPGSRGIGSWGLMGYGSWGTDVQPGDRPVGMSAWSRYFQGWSDPTVVYGSGGVTIESATSDPGEVFMLGENVNDVDWSFGSPGTGEFFLVENRQLTNWDASLPGCGLVVWHVDETQSNNNNDARRIVDIEEADDATNFGSPDQASDTFRIGGTATTFGPATSPNSNYYSGSPSQVSVEATSGCGPTMTANVSTPTPPPPPPANDDFADAIDVSGDNLGIFGTTGGTNEWATTQPNEYDAHGPSVWWKWTAPANGILAVDTFGSDFDTVLTAFVGGLDTDSMVVNNDDAPSGGVQSLATLPVTAGTTYHLRVRGWGGAEGNIDLGWALHAPEDAFGSAVELTGPSGSIEASTLDLGAEPDEPTHPNGTGRSLWYDWTAPSDGILLLDAPAPNPAPSPAPGTGQPTSVIAVYTGPTIDALTPAPAMGAGTGLVDVRVTAGTTYRIALDHTDDTIGLASLGWFLDDLAHATIGDEAVAEEDGSVDLTVTLDRPAVGGEQVRVVSADDSADDTDVDHVDELVTFTTGQTSATVTMTVLDDAIPESSEDVTVELRDADGLTVGSPATVTISDTDVEPDPFPGHETVEVAGLDRIETSVLASQAVWGDTGGSGRQAAAAVIASSRAFPDALVGTPLAADREGPMLLTNPSALHDSIATELGRILPAGAPVYVLGGQAALAPEVQTALVDLGYTVTRLAGNNRYETGVAVADELGDVDAVLVATGRNFPDALAAGSAAAHINGVVLLSADDVLPTATADAIAARPNADLYAVGGQAARAVPQATPFAGSDRYQTAQLAADALFDAPVWIGLASGVNFPDALSGGVHAAANGAPLVLTHPERLPDTTADYLTVAEPNRVAIYGGTAAVGDAVRAAVTAILDAMA